MRNFQDAAFGLTRRRLMQAAGVLAGAGAMPALAQSPTTLDLRVLATSDLHMFALDWDYFRNRNEPSVGLNKVATLIAAARAEATNTLLFDNGDILQGNPLGDFVVQAHPPAPERPHPMMMAMNLLRYDAATLGNHEFNYGLPFLESALAGARFPFVCSNLRRMDGTSLVSESLLIERVFTDSAGVGHPLKIGVIGFTPPQIMTWDRRHLEGKLVCEDIIEAARRAIGALRPRCDVLIALSHSGIGTGQRSSNEENASLHLAELGGVDAIITGHSHRVFPGPDYQNRDPRIDADKGTLAGVPAVMPGFWGSHLALIDLRLEKTGERWRVSSHSCAVRPIARREQGKLVPVVAAAPQIEAAIAEPHALTKAWVEKPVGVLSAPVHSYFALLGRDPASNIVNAAQRWYAQRLLAGTPHAALPLLSAVAPFKVGYTPDWFVDIAGGKVALRDIADLYVYPNSLTVVNVKGRTLAAWLEQAARVFQRIEPGASGVQELLNSRVPSYNFDILDGEIAYQIDLSRAPEGAAQSGRITGLTFRGQPLDPEADFLVATNNYRADGGGRFPGLDGSNIVLRAPDSNRDVVLDYVARQSPVPVRVEAPWRFAPLAAPARVWLDSGMGALAHVNEIAGLTVVAGGREGYQRFELTL